jgi:hypothetical protein
VAHPGLRRLHYRVALVLTGTLLLLIATMLPFTVVSVVDDVLGPPSSHAFPITSRQHSPATPHVDLHAAVIAIDEVQLLATLRVSGHHICPTACGWSDQLTFFSLHDEQAGAEGLPPSQSVTLPPASVAVTQTFQLPLRGQPIHFPFDAYALRLGVAMQLSFPDGTLQALSPAEAADRLFLTLQEQLPLARMEPPVALDPGALRAGDGPTEYLHVVELSFNRPWYLRILAILLVLLIAGAAAYAVFMRPVQDLVVNSGALVLGVWGIRSILVPAYLGFATAVDLSLAVVILFLLGAITARVLQFVYERSELKLGPLGRPPRPDPPEEASPTPR